MKGIILSMIAGKYEVYLENGQTITYSPRGKLRHLKVNLVVGDKVEIENDVISKVYERENFLYRPRIANIDLVIIIQSLSEPDFSSYLLDKFLTLVNIYHLKPCVILTKEDLYDEEKVKSIVEDYKSLNIDVISFHRGDTEKIALIKDKNNLLDDELFYNFLNKIIAFIWAYAVVNPGVNALRTPVYAEMVNIVNKEPVTFAEYKFEEGAVRNIFANFVFSNIRPITKSMLAILGRYKKFSLS